MEKKRKEDKPPKRGPSRQFHCEACMLAWVERSHCYEGKWPPSEHCESAIIAHGVTIIPSGQFRSRLATSIILTTPHPTSFLPTSVVFTLLKIVTSGALLVIMGCCRQYLRGAAKHYSLLKEINMLSRNTKWAVLSQVKWLLFPSLLLLCWAIYVEKI